MKLDRSRHPLPSRPAKRRARGVRSAIGAAVAVLVAGSALAQSAGMARLLGSERAPSHVNEPGGQRENRTNGAKHYRIERASARRDESSNLSPDERRRLRQNLYELSREMYKGS